jgi:hypothetical protein
MCLPSAVSFRKWIELPVSPLEECMKYDLQESPVGKSFMAFSDGVLAIRKSIAEIMNM